MPSRVTIQKYNVTVLEAIYHVVAHIFATKMLTGEDLGFYKHLKAATHTQKTRLRCVCLRDVGSAVSLSERTSPCRLTRPRAAAGTPPSRCRCAPAEGRRPPPGGSRSCPRWPESAQPP